MARRWLQPNARNQRGHKKKRGKCYRVWCVSVHLPKRIGLWGSPDGKTLVGKGNGCCGLTVGAVLIVSAAIRQSVSKEFDDL